MVTIEKLYIFYFYLSNLVFSLTDKVLDMYVLMKNVKVTMATSILEYTYQGHLKLKQLGKCYYGNQYIRVHIPGASSVLTSSAVDQGFESRSGQTKDYKIGICCFSVSMQH